MMSTTTIPLHEIAFEPAALESCVVVGYDGHDHSLPALRWAADWASTRGMRLVLLGSYSEPVPTTYGVAASGVAMYDINTHMFDTIEPLREVMTTAVADLQTRHPELDVRVCMVNDSPRRMLDQAADHAALLVVGTRRRSGVEALALGSVSEVLTTQPRCPVAVIAADALPLPGGPVVVGLDEDASSSGAMEFAIDTASRTGSPLYTLQAYDAKSADAIAHFDHTTTEAFLTRYGLQVAQLNTYGSAPVANPDHQEAFARRQDAPFDAIAREARGFGVKDDAVEAAAADARTIEELSEHSDAVISDYVRTHPHVDIVRIVHPGSPAEVLVEASEGASLMVVGTRGLNRWQRLFTTSTSREVLLNAACPVVVVPSTDR